MTQNKISNERVAELLGLLRQDIKDGYGDVITKWTKADRSYCYGRTDELDFTNPAWTGLLLYRLREATESEGGFEIIYYPANINSHGEYRVQYVWLPEMKCEESKNLNTAIIAALDALDKEEK